MKAVVRAIELQKASGDRRLMRADIANFLDTQACLFALAGDFKRATVTEQQAIAISLKPEFQERLDSFRGPSPRDCTGAA
jgi:hypothetical protein